MGETCISPLDPERRPLQPPPLRTRNGLARRAFGWPRLYLDDGESAAAFRQDVDLSDLGAQSAGQNAVPLEAQDEAAECLGKEPEAQGPAPRDGSASSATVPHPGEFSRSARS